MRRSRGFTLIELLVTLAIAALLAMFAVPAWSTFWARQQAKADVNTVISALTLARSEAIKQSRDVHIEFLPPVVDASGRHPEDCRDDETLEQNDGQERYTYPAWCYRVVEEDTDAGGGEKAPLRIGQMKRLSKPDTKFLLTFEPLGTADIGDCPTVISHSCRLAFMPDDLEHDSDDYSVTLFINIMGSIRREAP